MTDRAMVIAIFIAGLMVSNEALSVELSKKTIDQMVSGSDLIMGGKVMALSSSETSADQLAKIQGISGIRGLADVTLIYRTGIREFDPDCCEVGKTYLFFRGANPMAYFLR